MKVFFSHLLILSFMFVNAQDLKPTTNSEDDFKTLRFLFHGGIGFGNIENESAPNYNLNLDYIEMLFNYRFSSKYGVATGIGINEFSGNGFNSNGNFYHEREELRIPLLATADYQFNDKIRAIVGVGFYGKTNLSDDYRFLNTLEKDIYEDWSFGFQGNFGLLFSFSPLYSFGLNFNTQADFTDVDAKEGQSISGEQRMKNVSALGVIVLLQF